jgi:hypothetical protein
VLELGYGFGIAVRKAQGEPTSFSLRMAAFDRIAIGAVRSRGTRD